MLDKVTRKDPDAELTPDGHLRRLELDNEDLRFECARLRASLEQAQVEILSLTDRGIALQHRLDRLHRLAPRGSRRVVAFVRSLFGRR